MDVKDAASALGEAIGNLVQDAINEIIERIVKEYGYRISDVKELMDKAGVKFEIDFPIERNGKIVALIDVKYLRYKKHARDKGSWVVVAHNRLRATYPTIKKCVVILLGHGWTKDAKKLIRTSCIDVIDVTPEVLDETLSKYGIEFVWNEKNDETPKKAWGKWRSLSEEVKQQIKNDIIKKIGVEEKIRSVLINIETPYNDECIMKLNYIDKRKLSTLNRFIS